MKRVTRSENEQKEKGKKRFRGTLHDYYMCTYVTTSFKIPFFLFISNFFCDYESSLAPSFFFLLFLFPSFRRTYRFRLILSERERPLVFSSLLSFFSSFSFFFYPFFFRNACTACKGSFIRRSRNAEETQASANRSFVAASDFSFTWIFRVTLASNVSARDPTIDR